jgi:hypothetical protein
MCYSIESLFFPPTSEVYTERANIQVSDIHFDSLFEVCLSTSHRTVN